MHLAQGCHIITSRLAEVQSNDDISCLPHIQMGMCYSGDHNNIFIVWILLVNHGSFDLIVGLQYNFMMRPVQAATQYAQLHVKASTCFLKGGFAPEECTTQGCSFFVAMLLVDHVADI